MADSDKGRTDPDACWVEVTHPLPDAMRALAGCVEGSAQELRGASIGITKEGTLLLNERAWTLCGPALEALPNLITERTRMKDSQVLRFLLKDSE